MGAAEKGIWRELVSARAPDHFDSAARVLLRQYCEHAALHRALIGQLDPAAPDRDIMKAARAEAATCSTLATKLRLAPSSSMRAEDGRLKETPRPKSPLLGGNVTNFGRAG
jgi:hypothetical protein